MNLRLDFGGVGGILGGDGRDLAGDAALVAPLGVGVAEVEQQVLPRPQVRTALVHYSRVHHRAFIQHYINNNNNSNNNIRT